MFEIITPSKKIIIDFEKDGIPYNLDNYVSNGEVSLINATTILNYIPLYKFDNTVNNYISKLGINGRLVIGGTNMDAVVRLRMNGQISPLTFNSILYGNGGSITETKMSAYTPQTILKFLQESKLKISLYSVEKTIFVVGGDR